MSSTGGRRDRPPISLWLVDLERCAEALLRLERLSPRLADDDLARLSQMQNAAARRERQLSAIALRLVLSRVAGDARYDRVAFSRTARGKPFLAGCPVSFSLSHSAGFAMIAAAKEADQPIGVDLQPVEPLQMSADRRARLIRAGALLSRAPLPAIEDGDDTVATIQAWVRIEALAKATGLGLAPVLNRLGVMGRTREASDASAAAAELLSGIELGDRDLEVHHPAMRAALASPRCAVDVAAGIMLVPGDAAALDDFLTCR